MNKYQKAFNTITNTLICYMIRRDLYPLPSDDEIYNAQMVLSKLVSKAESFEWIPFTFDEEGVLIVDSYQYTKQELKATKIIE